MASQTRQDKSTPTKGRRPNKKPTGTSLTALAEDLADKHLIFSSHRTVINLYKELVKRHGVFSWDDLKDEYGNITITDETKALWESILIQLGAVEDDNLIKEMLRKRPEEIEMDKLLTFYDLVSDRVLLQYPNEADEPRRTAILDDLDQTLRLRAFVLMNAIKVEVEAGLEVAEIIDDYPLLIQHLDSFYRVAKAFNNLGQTLAGKAEPEI